MGLAVEQSCSHYDKEIARSSELKNFLFHLSDRAPSAMDELLKSASQRCDQALRAEVEARKAKKRAMSPINHEKDNKRQKIALSTEKDTAFSRQTADSDLCGQVCNRTEFSSRRSEANHLRRRKVTMLVI